MQSMASASYADDQARSSEGEQSRQEGSLRLISALITSSYRHQKSLHLSLAAARLCLRRAVVFGPVHLFLFAPGSAGGLLAATKGTDKERGAGRRELR